MVLVSHPIARNFAWRITGVISTMDTRGRSFIRAQAPSSRSHSLMDRRDITDFRKIQPLELYVRSSRSAGVCVTGDHRDHVGELSSSAGETPELETRRQLIRKGAIRAIQTSHYRVMGRGP